MSDDEERIKAVAGKAMTWWDRARVTVLGLGILGAVVSTAFVVGSAQSEIMGQLASLSEKVTEVRDTVRVMTGRLDEHGQAIAAVNERLGKLEVAREEQSRNIALFWARDWTDIRSRVERIEQMLIHADRPTVRQREPQR